jgi:[acyl-carrier-protein] S-malonyltransferase
MGRDLYHGFATARELFDRADTILGRRISRLCFEGPADELGKTSNAQPAIYLTSLACLAVAREQGAVEDPPAYVSGHSLGEYSALAAASALSFEDGLRLVETRGRLTQEAAEATPGSMAAILGLDEDAARAVCEETGTELCNINSPGQLVIGGFRDAVEKARESAVARGARRAIALDVGGAFHTSLMAPAVPEFRDALVQTEIRSPQAPVVLNDTATATTNPDVIRAELSFQLTHPVRWVQCVDFMVSQGVTEFIEIGPGRVLSGLIKRIASSVAIRNISGAGE